MNSGKCGKSMCICPFSLGLALGLTCALGVMFWFVWGTYIGSMPAMPSYMEPPASWSEAGMRAFWVLVKGFVSGFVIALIYDFIACMCKSKCCKKSGGEGSCGCNCNK